MATCGGKAARKEYKQRTRRSPSFRPIATTPMRLTTEGVGAAGVAISGVAVGNVTVEDEIVEEVAVGDVPVDVAVGNIMNARVTYGDQNRFCSAKRASTSWLVRAISLKLIGAAWPLPRAV